MTLSKMEKVLLCWVSIIPSVLHSEGRKLVFYAECRFAECRYAGCRHAECHGAGWLGLPGTNTLSHFARWYVTRKKGL